MIKNNDLLDACFTEFYKIYSGMKWEDIVKKINKDRNAEHKECMTYVLCRDMLDAFTAGFSEYDDTTTVDNWPDGKLFVDIALKTDFRFMRAMAYFYLKDFKKCLKEIQDTAFNNSEDAQHYNENNFVYQFLSCFKNGFSGLWKFVAKKLEKDKVPQSTISMCFVFDQYYGTKDVSKRIEILESALVDNDFYIYKEYLALEYYINKQWYQAVAYLDTVIDNCDNYVGVFGLDNLCFFAGYAYSSIKEYNTSILYYERTLKINPNYENACNNLGYSYYKIKKYDKALELFQNCIDKKITLKYAVNNIVRTFLAMGEREKARAFIKSAPYKVAKDLVQKANEVKEKVPVKNDITENDKDYINVSTPNSRKTENQFSSEKLLEDELYARLISEKSIFGKDLKLYRRKGEPAGRQYPIQGVGRLDLLAEDTEGNLYIIELKKDSGYDDPYQQTVRYIDWFIKNKKAGDKNVYGIICLNNPTKALINKVRKDERISLYEYALSYNEVR